MPCVVNEILKLPNYPNNQDFSLSIVRFSASVLVVALDLASCEVLVLVAALASGRILVSGPTMASTCGNSAIWASWELVARIIFARHPNAIDYTATGWK